MASNSEKHSGHTPATEVTPNFPQVCFHLPDERHTQRPTKLNQFKILTDGLSIFLVEALEPFPHGLTSRIGPKKDHVKDRFSIHRITHHCLAEVDTSADELNWYCGHRPGRAAPLSRPVSSAWFAVRDGRQGGVALPGRGIYHQFGPLAYTALGGLLLVRGFRPLVDRK